MVCCGGGLRLHSGTCSGVRRTLKHQCEMRADSAIAFWSELATLYQGFPHRLTAGRVGTLAKQA
eukprot:11542696-Alexandrium_andersonii.AAC.1